MHSTIHILAKQEIWAIPHPHLWALILTTPHPTVAIQVEPFPVIISELSFSLLHILAIQVEPFPILISELSFSLLHILAIQIEPFPILILLWFLFLELILHI